MTDGRTYDCPNCGQKMHVTGWSPEFKSIGCQRCGTEMTARMHKSELSLLEFLQDDQTTSTQGV